VHFLWLCSGRLFPLALCGTHTHTQTLSIEPLLFQTGQTGQLASQMKRSKKRRQNLMNLICAPQTKPGPKRRTTTSCQASKQPIQLDPLSLTAQLTILHSYTSKLYTALHLSITHRPISKSARQSFRLIEPSQPFASSDCLSSIISSAPTARRPISKMLLPHSPGQTLATALLASSNALPKAPPRVKSATCNQFHSSQTSS